MDVVILRGNEGKLHPQSAIKKLISLHQRVPDISLLYQCIKYNHTNDYISLKLLSKQSERRRAEGGARLLIIFLLLFRCGAGCRVEGACRMINRAWIWQRHGQTSLLRVFLRRRCQWSHGSAREALRAAGRGQNHLTERPLKLCAMLLAGAERGGGRVR